jgi:hypothetical protein
VRALEAHAPDGPVVLRRLDVPLAVGVLAAAWRRLLYVFMDIYSLYSKV